MTRKFQIRTGLAAIIAVAIIIPVAVYGQDSGDGEPVAQVEALVALDASFTFQGRLTDAGAPANGPYDFNFYLYEALVGGNQVGPVQTIPDVAVAAGLFTVKLNFGDVFHGSEYYLEIQVRPGASAGAYTTLSPREAVMAVPNAHYASEAGSLLVPQSNNGNSASPLLALQNSNAGAGAAGLAVESVNAPAIVGKSAGGPGGLFVTNTGSAIALDGPIKVQGSQPTAFVHVAAGGSYISVIDNPLLNGDPNAIVIATHVYNPPGPGGSIYQTSPFSVWYNGSNWTIYNDNTGTDIAANTAFFVLVIKR